MGFSDAVFNPHTFKLQPFEIIPIAPIGVGGSAPLVPLPGSSNLQFAQLTINDLRMQIKSLLYAEEASDSPSVQPQTAYELSLRQQTLAEKIGPLFSRLQQEFLEPVVERFMFILHDMGILPRPKLGDMPIKFIYKSPLALAKGQQDVARFTQYIQLMQGVMGAEATTLYVNPATTPYLLADSLQIDPRYLNKPKDIANIMQNQQNKLSAMDATAMTPDAPQNPSEQNIIPEQ